MNKQTQEPRYVGTNWDEVKVAETNGARGTTARKVVTRGEHRIDAGELIAQVVARLRQGYDIRLTDGKGEDAIRIYPCVSKDATRMEATARTMNGLKASLHDKTVELRSPKGEKVETEAGNEGDDAPRGVTPDIMVTCEICGHRQRLGQARR